MSSGSFKGDVLTTWLTERGDDRRMRLEADFSYIDPSKRLWRAPKGRTIDGTSIPEFLWSPLIGTPFTGDYRRASVVHDIACQDRPYTSDLAHKMFYYAMLCDGTPAWLAKTFYAAVRLFGPQWGNRRASAKQTTDNIRCFSKLVHSDAFVNAKTIRALDIVIGTGFR